MTKRQPFFVCSHCGQKHNRNPRQARYCSDRCALLSRVSNEDLQSTDGCWNWTGSFAAGYPQVTINGRHGRAHRMLYEITYGPIEGSHVFCCHRCDNPRCIRPDHIFLGSAAENMADCVRKNRIATGVQHGRATLGDEDVIAIRSSKLPARELADKFGVTPNTVTHIRSDRGWTHLPSAKELGGAPNSTSFRKKLTPEDVSFIRSNFTPGDPSFGRRALMKRFGVDKSTITNAVQGRSHRAS